MDETVGWPEIDPYFNLYHCYLIADIYDFSMLIFDM